MAVQLVLRDPTAAKKINFGLSASVTLTAGALAFTGQTFTLQAGANVTLTPGALAFTGQTVTVDAAIGAVASDALGGFGLRAGVRDFVELALQSALSRRVLIEMRPVKIVTGWSVEDAGNTWCASVNLVYDGVLRDVVGVRMIDEAGNVLDQPTRVETLALCRATPGSYFFDGPDFAPLSTRKWDDGLGQWWDKPTGTYRWDDVARLYVHPFSNLNPNRGVIAAQLGWYVATVGEWHPALGPDKLINGDFETWNSSSDVASWTETTTAGCAVAKEATIVRRGSFSCKLSATNATNPEAAVDQDLLAVPAAGMYRVDGYYQTSVGNAVPAFVRFGIPGSSQFALSDGRNFDSGDGAQLSETAGEWRRFTFDVRAWAAGTFNLRLRMKKTGAALSGVVYFDRVRVRPIFRWNYWEPRLQDSGVPGVEAAAQDVFFGGRTVGSGSLGITNADRILDPALGNLDWIGAETRLMIGGAFPDHQYLTIDDYRTQFTAYVQRIQADDAFVSVELLDSKANVHRQIPFRLFSNATFLNLDSTLEGKARRILIGTKTGIEPARIDLTPSTSLPIVEICDTTESPNGIKSIDAVYAYVTTDDADARNATRRITLAAGTDYSTDLANGRVTVLRDPGPYELLAGTSDRLEINVGAGRLIGNLTPGLYTGAGLAAHAQAVLVALAAGITVAYSETTHLFTVAKASGTLQLLMPGDGAKFQARNAWRVFGITADSDLTGSLSYVATTSVYLGIEKLVLRVDAKGFADDASGTYTGTPNAVIEKAPDVVRLIWRRFMAQPASAIDDASFVAARTTTPQPLGIYVQDLVDTSAIFETIEASVIAAIVLDGEGMLYFDPYTNVVDAGAPLLENADLLEALVEQRGVDDTYAEVKILYDEDPATGSKKNVVVATPRVKLQMNRPDAREFDTYLTSRSDAATLANNVATLSSAGPRIATVKVRGRLLDRRLGQQVTLTRSRAPFDPSGADAAKRYRILRYRHSPLSGPTEATLVEHVQL